MQDVAPPSAMGWNFPAGQAVQALGDDETNDPAAQVDTQVEDPAVEYWPDGQVWHDVEALPPADTKTVRTFPVDVAVTAALNVMVKVPDVVKEAMVVPVGILPAAAETVYPTTTPAGHAVAEVIVEPDEVEVIMAVTDIGKNVPAAQLVHTPVPAAAYLPAPQPTMELAPVPAKRGATLITTPEPPAAPVVVETTAVAGQDSW